MLASNRRRREGFLFFFSSGTLVRHFALYIMLLLWVWSHAGWLAAFYIYSPIAIIVKLMNQSFKLKTIAPPWITYFSRT